MTTSTLAPIEPSRIARHVIPTSIALVFLLVGLSVTLSDRVRVSLSNHRQIPARTIRSAQNPVNETPPTPALICAPQSLPPDTKLTRPPGDTPQTLRDYARWHATARACLSNPRCADKPDVLVWRCLPNGQCAGMGDRFRGINLVFLLAIISKRVFFIDLPQGRYNMFPLTSAVLPAAIDWTLPSQFEYPPGAPYLNWQNPSSYSSAELPGGLSIDLYRDEFSAVLKQYPVVSIKTNAALNVLRKLLTHQNEHGWLEDLQPNVIPTGMLLRVFAHMLYKPTAAVETLARKALPYRFGKHGYIGVHVRAGEDVEEGGIGRFQYLSNNYTAVASTLLDCTMQVDTSHTRRVYLASDSHSVKREYARLADRYGVQVATLSGRAMHVSQKVGGMSKEDRQQKCVSYLNVFVDLFNLANGESVVTTGSGFARAAYTIGDATQLRIALSRDGVRCATAKLRR